jgi:hypothetical protein
MAKLAQKQIDIMESKNKNIFVRLKDLLFDHEYEKAQEKFNDYCDALNEINFKILVMALNMGNMGHYYKQSKELDNYIKVHTGIPVSD